MENKAHEFQPTIAYVGKKQYLCTEIQRKTMKKIPYSSKCYHCKRSLYVINGNTGGKRFVCMHNKCERHAAFLPEDWRDMVFLENDYAEMPADERHRNAEIECEHIVQVYESNKRDRAARAAWETELEYNKQKILARIKAEGGIDGMKLIAATK